MASNADLAEAFLNSDAINDDYFIQIVENKFKISRDEFKLKLVLLSPATGNNENFVAALYRAKIKFEIIETKAIQVIDVILKVLLSTMPEMKEFSVFPRERFAYEHIIGSFEELWLERASETIKFAPRMVKSETDPYEQIVLDDLKVEGFEMLNRKVGLNMNQTKAFLAKIAQFHAAGAVRYQKDGVINEFLDRKATLKMPEDSSFVQAFVKLAKSFAGIVRNYGDCDVYAEKIGRWDMSKVGTMFVDVAEPMRSGFVVLNHGDCWLNNMMFKLDPEGNALDVSLIDFQGPFWGGPAGDLLYFLVSSVADDIKIEYFDELVAFYHQNLIESLKKLKYDHPIPTLADLHIDLLDKGYFPCCNLILLLFIVKYDSPEELTLEMILSGADDPVLLNRVFNNPNYMKAVKPWLKFLNTRGYLDTMLKQD